MFTVMALIAPAVVGLGFVLFLTLTGALQAVAVFLMSVGASMGLAGVIFRQRALGLLHRLERSNADPSPPSSAIPPLERLNRLWLYQAVLGAVIAGGGLVSFLTLGTRWQWAGVFLLVVGALITAVSVWFRRRYRRLIDRLRTLSAVR
jgi:hypothetical protein